MVLPILYTPSSLSCFWRSHLFLLEKPVATLGIGVSYGVFTGLGIVGTSIVGIVGLGEAISLPKIASIAVLMIGVIGLKYCDAKEAAKQASKMVEEYNLSHSKEGGW